MPQKPLQFNIKQQKWSGDIDHYREKISKLDCLAEKGLVTKFRPFYHNQFHINCVSRQNDENFFLEFLIILFQNILCP